MIALKSYSAFTDQGPYLQVNEDVVEVDLINHLYILIDGFGGSNVGDKAANFVKDTIKKFYTKVGGDPDSTLPFFFSHKYLIEGNALINSMHYAHSLLMDENRQKEMSSRGGASAIAVSQAENILTIASTGNAKAYLYRKGELSQLVEPDNLDNISFDRYQRHFHTAPMSGFGLFDDLHLNVKEHRVQEDDQILLLTDGAYARAEDHEILYIIERKRKSASDKIREIFDLSNSRGNLDNQSCIMLNF